MSLESKLLGTKTKHAVIIPDLHVPYHDEKALQVVENYIKDTKPFAIYQIGDMYDFYSISRFDKDPSRIETLQDEIDKGYEIWERIKNASPSSELHHLTGNHETRLKKYLWRHPELHSLKALKLENVLRLKELGVKHHDVEEVVYINKSLIVTHGANDDGCKLSQYSGYSAKNTLEKNGISGISGHTHRLASHYSRKLGGQLEWHEAGSLCTLNPDYVKKPNWQQGFARVLFNQKQFDVDLIRIHNFHGKYWAVADGKIYKDNMSNKSLKNGKDTQPASK
jgi:hypothetical protein